MEVIIGLPFAFAIAYIAIHDAVKLGGSPVRLPEPEPVAPTTEKPEKIQQNGGNRPKLEIVNDLNQDQ